MFYKSVENGIIMTINTIGMGEEITEDEYNSILEKIKTKPIDNNAMYQLTENLEWVRIELPPSPLKEEEATAEDYENALGRFGV